MLPCCGGQRCGHAATARDSGSSSNRTRTLAIEYLTGLMYDRALSRYRVVKLDASALDPAREIDELRAALGNVLDHALG